MAMPGVEEMSHCDYVQVAAVFVGLFVFWLLREMFCLVILFPNPPTLRFNYVYDMYLWVSWKKPAHYALVLSNSYEKYVM